MIQAERHGRINPAQMAIREVARTAIHPVFLRNETIDQFGGLRRFHNLIRSGTGGIVVEMHFSQVDPLWAIDGVTKQMGLRNVPIAQPIAYDRTPPGLVAFCKAVGVNLIKVVTPDVKTRAEEKGKDVIPKAGQEEDLQEALNVVRRKGVAFVPPKATREHTLTQNGRSQAVTTLLLSKLYMGGEKDVAIHFLAFDMDDIRSTEDYRKKRKYNFFQKHRTLHGNTYTLSQLVDLAAGEAQEGESTRKRTFRAFYNMESVVYSELSKIVPVSYLPPELRSRRLAVDSLYSILQRSHPNTLSHSEIERYVDNYIQRGNTISGESVKELWWQQVHKEAYSRGGTHVPH